MLFYVESLFDMSRPGAPELRKKHGKDHKAYLLANQDRMLVRGPTFDEAGVPDSSIMVIEYEDRRALQRFLEEEPFAKSGLIYGFNIHIFEKHYPRPPSECTET